MLKIYNTLSRKKEKFKAVNTGKVGMYACGPTVYDYAHIGNLKTFIFEDVLHRYLEYKGFEVRYIMNITDVGHLTDDDVNQADSGEDKMLKAALREKKTPEEIANFYSDKFFEAIEKLNFVKANFYPRASAHIPQIIKFVKELIGKGYAYEVNGNVFYDVSKFKNYGRLSGKKIEDLKNGARLEKHPDKKHPYDFALWLKAPEKHILKWKSPWSFGYPGWHIECSVMSMEYLGETLDIHTGGEDHIFPHHENEIAQSEALTGKKFVNYWLHARFMMINSDKMSKSKGNFFALEDILEKGYSSMDFRLLALSGHYRSNQNFTWEAMNQAKANLGRISDWVNNLKEDFPKAKLLENQSLALEKYQEKFEEAMDDDLNTPLALSVLYELITETNKLTPSNTKEILSLWEKMNKVFGLIITERETKLDGETQKLVDEREVARKNKDFQKSDDIRKLIEAKGYLVEDKKDGYKIKRSKYF